MHWLEERFEAERKAELAAKQRAEAAELRATILKLQVPRLWRRLSEECQSCVKRFNERYGRDRTAVFQTESNTEFRVERTRPGNALVTAILRLDGYRVDYRLIGAEGSPNQIDAVLGFETAKEEASLTNDDGPISIEAAGKLLLERVLFP